MFSKKGAPYRQGRWCQSLNSLINKDSTLLAKIVSGTSFAFKSHCSIFKSKLKKILIVVVLYLYESELQVCDPLFSSYNFASCVEKFPHIKQFE